MSEVMLIGVLRMPPELWRGDQPDVMQRYGRYQQAADEIERLRAALEQIARYPQTRADELGYEGCRKLARKALEI